MLKIEQYAKEKLGIKCECVQNVVILQDKYVDV